MSALSAAAITAQTAALLPWQITISGGVNATAANIALQTTSLNTTIPTANAAAHFAAQATYDGVLNAAAILQGGVLVTQLGYYYDAARDAIDARDLQMDKQIAFMQQLHDLRDNQDLPMLEHKKDIITDLNLPVTDACWESTRFIDASELDGQGVDVKSRQLASESCEGIPTGWKTHDGLLAGARVASYNSGILVNADKRRVENFRNTKTKLMRSAQIAVKSVYSSGDTLSQYAQASAIHGGVADMYIQGFNSAGAALGVISGRATGGG